MALPQTSRTESQLKSAEGCYALDEMMVEKIRAVLGQRIYAVSRDLYDIFFLKERVASREGARARPAKMAARDLARDAIDPTLLTDRTAEFEADWERNLVDLLPPGARAEFRPVWKGVVEYVSQLIDELDS